MSIPYIQYSLTNLFIPAGGTVHGVSYHGKYTNVPEIIDWAQFKIDNFPFRPQGGYFDNLDGGSDLTITIQPIGWRVIVSPGQQRAVNFPAVQNGRVEITGDPAADVTLVFVDFPVLPDSFTRSI